MSRSARPAQPRSRWFNLGVGSIGATSLLSDSGHEMVTAVLPGFVVGALGGSAATLGVIEGCADALTGLSKLAGGPIADDPRRRQAMASGGYATTAIATSAIGLATALWQVGVLRAISWAARGFRAPARDAMLATLASDDARGRAYGVERAGDNLGAVIGPLLGGLLVAWIGVRATILLSLIPGLLAAVAIMIAARQARRIVQAPGARRRLRDGYQQLRGTGFGRVLVPAALFEGGHLAATLLILRANQLFIDDGMGVVAAVASTTVLYAAYNAAAAGVSLPAGMLIDRFGARVVLAFGGLSFVAAYAGFAFAAPSGDGRIGWLVLVFFVLGGVGIGVGETAQSALVAGALPDWLRGSGFGMFGLVQAGGDVTATIIGGALYGAFGPVVCFSYAAIWMLASAATAASAHRSRQAPLESRRQETP